MSIMKELEEFAKAYRCYCKENYPGATEYHGHDCLNEAVQEFVAEFQEHVVKTIINNSQEE